MAAKHDGYNKESAHSCTPFLNAPNHSRQRCTADNSALFVGARPALQAARPWCSALARLVATLRPSITAIPPNQKFQQRGQSFHVLPVLLHSCLFR